MKTPHMGDGSCLCCSSERFLNAHKLIGLVSRKLMGKGLILATAESCTGGLIAKLCTDLAGSSAWFLGGAVVYSNSLKTALLGVDKELIAQNGAVSGPVVKAMAVGAVERLGADCSVAVSGIAGPGGGSVEKPVGTVWMAAAVRGGKDEGGDGKDNGNIRVVGRMTCFAGSRDDVRQGAACGALETLLELL